MTTSLRSTVLASLLVLIPGASFADLTSSLDAPDLVFTSPTGSWWWETGGQWVTGSSSAQSGPIGDNDETILETTVTGPGVISFWWKASSESCCRWERPCMLHSPTMALASGPFTLF